MNIVKNRKIYYSISAILIVTSVVAILLWGLRSGIDFSGGSLLEISYEEERPATEDIIVAVSRAGFADASVRPTEDGFIVRAKEILQDEKDQIFENVSFGGRFKPIEKTFSNVGPVLGKEALMKSWVSIALVLLAIVLFIAFAFRKVSQISKFSSAKLPSSWVYGMVTVAALAHDVLIPTGVAAILGKLRGFEVDTLFVTALLVILGFSVHDTIVVFDRVRENLHKNEEFKEGKDFDEVVGKSIEETIVRSLNTSLTTLLAILALFVFGPESVRNFSLILIIGIAVGTYSSIFIGSPLLVTIQKYKETRK
jgi:preprotein translocase subunit SecF